MGPGLWRDDTRIVERPGWYQIITPSAPRNTQNEIIFSQLEEKDADGVIDETIATYRACGQATKWSVGPWTRPSDFGERLARRGFQSWEVRGMGCYTSAHL